MIIIIGVAGAGKSVQGRWVADELGLPWLSTGEFLRMLVTGKRRKEMIEGKLLGDSEMIELADKIFHMINIKEQFILDGFPRTKKQADWLIAQHDAGLINISKVIHLEASKEEVSKRLLERGRQDDTKEAIEARFKEYSEVTLPIIEEFEQNGVSVAHVDANRSPEEVHDDIKSLLS